MVLKVGRNTGLGCKPEEEQTNSGLHNKLLYPELALAGANVYIASFPSLAFKGSSSHRPSRFVFHR